MPSKLVGIRLPDDEYKKLEQIASKTNQTPNYLAKKAIIDWLEFDSHTNSMDVIILPKNSYADIIKLLSIDQLEVFCSQIAEKVVNHYNYMALQNEEYSSLDDFLRTMISFIGTRGLMWFDEIEFQTEEKPHYFKGKHKLGEIWSRIFLDIFTKIIEKQEFQFDLKAEKTTILPTMVYLEFEKR